MKSFLLLLASGAVWAAVMNPIVDTDKSVNTYSVPSIAADVVNSGMTDEQKLAALLTFHRRMMHHFRAQQNTEDGRTMSDAIKMYTVYGCSWCTQQAGVFRTLCSEVFGWDNCEGTAGDGTLASKGIPGAHSSFHLRFDANDSWHWVDPIIGAYAKNRTDGKIATFEQIAADPLILINAKSNGRASMPYFPCNTPPDPIAGTSYASAYSYFDYDTGFIADFAAAWTTNQYTNQRAYYTTKKILRKGESYLWYWDFLPGDYFNLHDQDSIAAGRAFGLYPPRHLCGWKDSLDVNNWPYFKPYKKVIKGDTCYRYYANGVHTFAPLLRETDPKEQTYVNSNMAFYADTRTLPALHPSSLNTLAEIAWRVKIPYPLMSMKLSCDWVKRNATDSLSISIARVFYKGNDPNRSLAGYTDTLSHGPYIPIRNFGVSTAGVFDSSMRSFVDPLNIDTTSQGYIIKVSMRARTASTDVGLNALKVECIFQHNMFALPQLEPGVNNVSVAVDSGSGLSGENLLLEFAWMDNGSKRTDARLIGSAPASYPVTVNQSSMPRMIHMKLSNSRADSIRVERGVIAEAIGPLSLACSPNPFGAAVTIRARGFSVKAGADLRIYDSRGRLLKGAALGGGGLFRWDASAFPPGVYLARLVSGNQSAMKKVVLAR